MDLDVCICAGGKAWAAENRYERKSQKSDVKKNDY